MFSNQDDELINDVSNEFISILSEVITKYLVVTIITTNT